MHSPTFELSNLATITKFIILHDSIPTMYPQYFPEINNENYWYNRLTQSLNKETHYFCVSSSTKNDYLKYYSDVLDEKKLYVTHIAPSQNYFQNYDSLKVHKVFRKYNIKYNESNKYVFSFCSLEPRKNIIFTVRCFIQFLKKNKIENLIFYLGGGDKDNFIDQLESQIENYYEYKDKIIRIGYVDDEDVNILYSNSLFFTYLSQYEGFGMPPLEAMAAGTPVICSNNSSLPEVVGDAAITIDYNNEEACIKAFEDFYFNEELRKEYIKRGLERAKLFSWEKTYKLMSNKIIEVISASKVE